jgi:hypothetical protein
MLPGEEYPETLMNNRVNVLRGQGKYEQAGERYRQVLKLRR